MMVELFAGPGVSRTPSFARAAVSHVGSVILESFSLKTAIGAVDMKPRRLASPDWTGRMVCCPENGRPCDIQMPPVNHFEGRAVISTVRPASRLGGQQVAPLTATPSGAT